MLVAGGHLSFVEDEALPPLLAGLYENQYPRILDNGVQYDRFFGEEFWGSVQRHWHLGEGRFVRTSVDANVEFLNRTRRVLGWNEYYIALLEDLLAEVEKVRGGVDEYLAGR